MGEGCGEGFRFWSGGPCRARSCTGLTRFISIRSDGSGFDAPEAIAITCGFSIGIGGLLCAALSTAKIRLSLRANASLGSMDVRLKEVLSFYARILIPFHGLRMFFILKRTVDSFTCSNIRSSNPIFFTRISTFIKPFGWIGLIIGCPLFIKFV